MIALEAGYDLGALALCFVALALLIAAKELAQALAGPLDFSVFGVRPLHRVAVAIEHGLVGMLDDAIRGVEKAAARFESGLIDSFGLLIAIPALAILGVKAALEYLWNSALKPTIRAITNPIKADADAALAQVHALYATVAANLTAAEEYARGRAAAALTAAKAYADTRVDAAIGLLRRDIGAAIAEAEGYADIAVGKLRAAEDAAIAGAVGLAAEAKLAGQAAAQAVLHTAEAEFAGAIAAQAVLEAAKLAELDQAGKAALAGLEGVVINVAGELHEIEGDLGAVGTAGLLASIPLLATLVHSIATEAGLDNAECRRKVKGVCGTDPGAWAKLLAGAALVAVPFGLAELVQVAKVVIDESRDVMAEFR